MTDYIVRARDDVNTCSDCWGKRVFDSSILAFVQKRIVFITKLNDFKLLKSTCDEILNSKIIAVETMMHTFQDWHSERGNQSLQR